MIGTIPTQKPMASLGASSTSDESWMSWATTGVMMIPPSERPVDAIESAIERLVWNQRVTRLVAGTRPVRA